MNLKKIPFYSVFVLSVAFVGCASHQDDQNVQLIPAAHRTLAPEIQARFLNSPGLNLAQLKGQVVVLDFWATWCGPCRMELPSLIKLYNQYHTQGLAVLGLSVEANDDHPDDYFRQFMASNGIDYPLGLADPATLQSYGINPIPMTVFIDRSGRIALSFVGLHAESDLDTAVEKLLSED